MADLRRRARVRGRDGSDGSLRRGVVRRAVMPHDVLAAVAEQEPGDETVGEPPGAADPLELVDVATGRDRLERQHVGLLEDRRVAARPARSPSTSMTTLVMTCFVRGVPSG